MSTLQTFAGASSVASCTLSAAHRRDHTHEDTSGPCHPHTVEVVHLGEQAAMVCHDCRTDSGFVPHRDAEHQARTHRHDTSSLRTR